MNAKNPSESPAQTPATRLSWQQAAARLDGFDCSIARNVEFGALRINGARYSISVHRRGAEIIYCRACEHAPASFCLISSDRADLEAPHG